MQLWRIHIRPGRANINPVKSYAFCLRKEVIGVAWGVESDDPQTLEHYVELYDNQYADETGKRAVRLLADMARGDLVWIRSTQGIYHLCQVDGPWQYSGSHEFREVDIVNYGRVSIAEVGVEMHVPGKVIASFRAARTLQRIADEATLAVSTLIWNKLTDDHLPITASTPDIFSMISSKDCEDLIAVYLQMNGWIVYPTRRQSDMPAYEFVLRHKADYREAVVQVKTGFTPIDLGALPSSVGVAFAFQANEQYIGRNPKAVIIKRDDVLNFISNYARLVPDAVAHWMKFVSQLDPWRTEDPHHFPIRQ